MKFTAFATLSLATTALGFTPPTSVTTSNGYSSGAMVLHSSPSNEQSNAGTPFMKSDQIRGIADSFYGNASERPNPLREATRARQGGDTRGFTNPALATNLYSNPSQVPNSLTEATRTREMEAEYVAPGGFNHPSFSTGRYDNPCEDGRSQPRSNSRTNVNFSDSRTFYSRVSDGLWDNPFGTRRSHIAESSASDVIRDPQEEIQQINKQIAELKETMAMEKEKIAAMIVEQQRQKEALMVNSREAEKVESKPELAMSSK